MWRHTSRTDQSFSEGLKSREREGDLFRLCGRSRRIGESCAWGLTGKLLDSFLHIGAPGMDRGFGGYPICFREGLLIFPVFTNLSGNLESKPGPDKVQQESDALANLVVSKCSPSRFHCRRRYSKRSFFAILLRGGSLSQTREGCEFFSREPSAG